jgi:hypothetical protein
VSLNLNPIFELVPYDPLKVRSALEAITAEIARVGRITRALGSVTFPSGVRKTWHETNLDFLRDLMKGTNPSVEVFWSSDKVNLNVHWIWDIALGCHFIGDDEQVLSQAVGILVRELGLSPLLGGPGASVQHLANPLAAALRGVDEVLWCRYVQACRDIADPGRLSYHAPMHDLRDILAGVLRTLAPDGEVTSQPGYVQDKGTSGPTQAQRARYILTVLRGRGSGAISAMKETMDLIDSISKIARATYSRASAAHEQASRDEASQILRYVQAVLSDLLGVTGR